MPASYAKISFDAVKDHIIDVDPNPALDCVVIIPAYAEEDVLTTLRSLQDSHSYWSNEGSNASRVEVILLINQSEDAAPEITSINEVGYHSIIDQDWQKLVVHVLYVRDLSLIHI